MKTGADMKIIVETETPEANNIVLAGRALEEIVSCYARMGGTLHRRTLVNSPLPDNTIRTYDNAVYITTTVRLKISGLSEYIAQSEKQEGDTP